MSVTRVRMTSRSCLRCVTSVLSPSVEASLVRCTLGEQVQAMADIYGRYSGGPEW